MSKNSNIIIRVSEEEKERAVKVLSALGEKSVSSLFRNYIDFIYEIIYPSSNCINIDFDRILDDLEKQLKSCHSFQQTGIKVKINTVKQLKDTYSLKTN